MRKKLLTALTLGVTLTAMTGSAFADAPDSGNSFFTEARPAATLYKISENGSEFEADEPAEGRFFTYQINTDDLMNGEDQTVSVHIAAASPMDEESYAEFINQLEDLNSEEKEALIENYKETQPLREELDQLYEALYEAEESQQEQILDKIDALQEQIDEATAPVSEILEKAGLHLLGASAACISISYAEDFDYEEYIRSIEGISEDVKDRLLEIHDFTMKSYDQLDDLYEKLEAAAAADRAEIEKSIDALIKEISDMAQEKSELLGVEMMEAFSTVRSVIADEFDGELFVLEFGELEMPQLPGGIDKAV